MIRSSTFLNGSNALVLAASFLVEAEVSAGGMAAGLMTYVDHNTAAVATLVAAAMATHRRAQWVDAVEALADLAVVVVVADAELVASSAADNTLEAVTVTVVADTTQAAVVPLAAAVAVDSLDMGKVVAGEVMAWVAAVFLEAVVAEEVGTERIPLRTVDIAATDRGGPSLLRQQQITRHISLTILLRAHISMNTRNNIPNTRERAARCARYYRR